MGMKRKASVFEDEKLAFQQHTGSDTPSLVSSSPLSTSTIQSSDGDAHGYDFYMVKAVPYLNSRTRKRHRDDRPNEETIHEHTLKKLYDAQRLHLDEAMPMSDVLDFDETHEQQEDEDADMTNDFPDAEIPQTAQFNQTTIDVFFGGKGVSQPQVPAPRGSQSHHAGFWKEAGR